MKLSSVNVTRSNLVYLIYSLIAGRNRATAAGLFVSQNWQKRSYRELKKLLSLLRPWYCQLEYRFFPPNIMIGEISRKLVVDITIVNWIHNWSSALLYIDVLFRPCQILNVHWNKCALVKHRFFSIFQNLEGLGGNLCFWQSVPCFESPPSPHRGTWYLNG